MSHFSQTLSVDFLELLLKRRHLKNLKRFAYKSIKKNKQEIQYNYENEIIGSNIDLSRNMLINI